MTLGVPFVAPMVNLVDAAHLSAIVARPLLSKFDGW